MRLIMLSSLESLSSLLISLCLELTQLEYFDEHDKMSCTLLYSKIMVSSLIVEPFCYPNILTDSKYISSLRRQYVIFSRCGVVVVLNANFMRHVTYLMFMHDLTCETLRCIFMFDYCSNVEFQCREVLETWIQKQQLLQ